MHRPNHGGLLELRNLYERQSLAEWLAVIAAILVIVAIAVLVLNG